MPPLDIRFCIPARSPATGRAGASNVCTWHICSQLTRADTRMLGHTGRMEARGLLDEATKQPLHVKRARACLVSKHTRTNKPVSWTLCGAAAGRQSTWATLQDCIGATPLVQLQRLGRPMSNNVLLAKLENSSITGSVTDRSAWGMICEAEAAGHIQPGNTLITASCDNMGVSLAMAAALKGYRLLVVVPQHMKEEREVLLAAYGAQIIYTPGGMEDARELAATLQTQGDGWLIDPYTNADNPLAHLRTTGPELWNQTGGQLTHLVVPMTSTGTAMGCSAYLKAVSPAIQIVGVEPTSGAHIPGLQRSQQSPTSLYQASRLDQLVQVTQPEAELCARVLARTEAILAGPSAGATVAAALKVSVQVSNAVIAVILNGRGECYLSASGLYGAGTSGTRTMTCQAQSFWSTVQCMAAGYPGPHYVLFIGADEAGSLWSSDCAGVSEAVQQAVSIAGGTLLVVHVGSKADWHQASQHPLRVEPRLQLRMLPSLMLWKHAGPARRAAGDVDALLNLVHSTAATQTTASEGIKSVPDATSVGPSPGAHGVQTGSKKQAAPEGMGATAGAHIPAPHQPAQPANNIVSLTTPSVTRTPQAAERSQPPQRADSVEV